MLWKLSPVPTIQTDVIAPLSVLRKPVIPRHAPTPRYCGKEQLSEFQIADKIICLDSLTQEHCPKGFSFNQYNSKVVYYNLCFDDITSIPSVHESIIIDEFLHVSLTYKGYHVPLPEWFRSGHNCKLNRFSMLENFPAYLKNKSTEINTILTEFNEIKYYKPQGRPTYSSSVIRYALLLRHTSAQSYKLLLDQLPLPSFSLLRKIQSGGLDAIKAIQLLLDNGSVSSDCVLLVDEMYLEKSAQYHGGKYVGEDEDGNPF